MRLLIILFTLFLSSYSFAQRSLLASGLEFGECALELFELMKHEQYDSLDKYLITFDQANSINGKKELSTDTYKKYRNEFFDNIKIAHDSLNIQNRVVRAIGQDIQYWSIYHPESPDQLDSAKVIQITLITDGLFFYEELTFYLQDFDGDCKLFDPNIESQTLGVKERKSTRDISTKNKDK